MNGGVKVNKLILRLQSLRNISWTFSFIICYVLFLHSYACILCFQIQLIFLVIFWALTKKYINRASEQNNLIITRLLLNHCEVQAECNSIYIDSRSIPAPDGTACIGLTYLKVLECNHVLHSVAYSYNEVLLNVLVCLTSPCITIPAVGPSSGMMVLPDLPYSWLDSKIGICSVPMPLSHLWNVS